MKWIRTDVSWVITNSVTKFEHWRPCTELNPRLAMIPLLDEFMSCSRFFYAANEAPHTHLGSVIAAAT
jgi:hypothetical protein